jgi:protein TIF31
MEEEEAKRIMETLTDSITSGEKQEMEDSTKEIVKKAAQIVGSLKDTEFDIRSEISYTRRLSKFFF